jgi:hypothetical protein
VHLSPGVPALVAFCNLLSELLSIYDKCQSFIQEDFKTVLSLYVTRLQSRESQRGYQCSVGVLNAVHTDFSQSVQAKQTKLWPSQFSNCNLHIGVPHGPRR